MLTSSRRLFSIFALVNMILAQGFFMTPAQAESKDVFPEFEQFFEKQQVILLMIDPETGEIIQANPEAAEFYGYSRDRLQNMSIQDINALTPEQVSEERRLATEQNRNFFIFRHALASGELRSVQVQSQPYSFAGKEFLLSIIHDITPERFEEADIWHYQSRLEAMVDAQVQEIEQKRRQQLLLLVSGLALQALVILLLLMNIQKRKKLQLENAILSHSLKEKNTDLRRLSEIMAHHFQEPARRLMVFARRLKQLSKLQTNQDAQYSLDFIDSQAERLSSLVRDVQRYLAIDHNLSETLLKSTDASIEQAFHQTDVPVEEINWQVQQSLPQVAMGERQFQQLFAALISNAWRYRHPERQLVLVIKAQIAKERLVFTVMDNGLGIAPEYRQQVFELFERLVPSSAPGTGLGLAIARKLVRGTGGQMTIENGLEDGIAVVFDLPLAVQELKDTP